MKHQREFTVVLIFVFLSIFALNPKNTYIKAQEENPLKIEKVIGMSDISGAFRDCNGIAIAKDGTIFIADQCESQIEVYDTNYQFIRSFGSIGEGDGQFFGIHKIRFDSQENLYVLDDILCRIQVFTKEGVFIKKWGEKEEENHQLYAPTDFAILPNRDIVVVDCQIYDEIKDTLKVFSNDGQYIRNFFKNSDFSSNSIQYHNVETDLNGKVYINAHYAIPIEELNEYDEAILRFSPQGELEAYYVDEEYHGLGADLYGCLSIGGSYLYIIDYIRVTQFRIQDNPTKLLTDFKEIVNSYDKEEDEFTIRSPSTLCCYGNRIFIADGDLNRIVIMDQQGTVLGKIQSPLFIYGADYQEKEIQSGILSRPSGITIGPDQQIYVVSCLHNIVKTFDTDGKEIHSFGKSYLNRMDNEQQSYPGDILFDKAGFCYVAVEFTSFIGVFTNDLAPHTIIELEASPTAMAINAEGLLVVSTDSYTKNKLLFYDISRMNNKQYTLKKSQTLALLKEQYSYRSISDMLFDKDDTLVVAYGYYSELFWVDSHGKKIKSIDFYTDIHGILKDGDGNLYVTLPEINSIYKLSPDGDIIWKSDVGWYRLQYLTMDSNGFLYVTDSMHDVFLKISDKTAVPPIITPPPAETEAVFSFQMQNETIVQGDTVSIRMIVEKLEFCHSIEIAIQFPADLLMFSTVTKGDLTKDADYRFLDQSQAFGNFTILIQSKKNPFGQSGVLLDLQFDAIRPGNGNVSFLTIELRNKDGEEIHFKEKKDLSFTILPKDKTPPKLIISPLPKEVTESQLIIEGATEPDAQVLVNQLLVEIKPDGTFSYTITLQEGLNTILISSTDKAGNTSELTFQVSLIKEIVIQLCIGKRILIINGKTIPIDSEPFIDQRSGRTMVPVRVIAESFGATIHYESVERRIEIQYNNLSLIFWIGNPKAVVNGKEVDIDPEKPVSPVIVKNRSYLPLRFIGEAFGFHVDWDPATQWITLTNYHEDGQLLIQSFP